MTHDPFARLAEAVLLHGCSILIDISHEPGPSVLSLSAIHPYVFVPPLEVLSTRALYFEDADLEAWEAFADALSDPLVAMSYLR